MKICALTIGLLLVAGFAFGADVDGKWTGLITGMDGNNISFSVTLDFGGQEMKMEYKGVVSADQINLTFDMMGQPSEIILKKAK